MGWLAEIISDLVDLVRAPFGSRGAAARLPRRRFGGKSGSALDALRNAAQSDPEAARFYLSQRILIADSIGAVEFYEQTLMRRFPDLTLSPADQVSLVRMFVFGNYREPALHASDLFLRRYPAEPGWEVVALNLGRLLLNGGKPEQLRDALRHLERVAAKASQKRDRAEATQLAEALRLQAEMAGLAFPEAAAEEAPSEPADATSDAPLSGLQMPTVSRPKKRILIKEGERREGEPILLQKPEERESDGTPAGAAALEGRRPLPVRSSSAPAGPRRDPHEGRRERSMPPAEQELEIPTAEPLRLPNRIAGLMPLDKARGAGAAPEASVYGESPGRDEMPAPSLGEEGERGSGEGAYGVSPPAEPREKQFRSEELPDGARRSLPRSDSTSEDPSTLPFSVASGMFDHTPLAQTADEKPVRVTKSEIRRKQEEGPKADAERGWTVLLKEPSPELVQVAESLALAHCDGGDAARAVQGVPGLLLREATAAAAEGLKTALAGEGIETLVVKEDASELCPGPEEAQSVLADKAGLSFATETGRVPVAPADVVLLYAGRTRLSRSSRSSQCVVEVIVREGGKCRRFALWERTWRPSACRFDEEPLGSEETLEDVADRLAGRVPPDALSTGLRDRTASQGALPVATTFREHEDRIAYELLRRCG